MNQHLPERRGASMRRIAVLSAAVLTLAACAEAQLGAQVAKGVARAGGDGSEQPQAASADPTLAPEAFDATGLTIWDGAATLQGVWLAHPLAQRAQRVRVSNLDNGLTVEGAMFRRDPALSGPSILVSSDAARGLGLTPGSPTELRIIALREGPEATRVAAVEPAPQPQSAESTATPSSASEPAPATEVETQTLAAPEPIEQPQAATPPPPEKQIPEEETEEIALDPVVTPEARAETKASPAPQPRPVNRTSTDRKTADRAPVAATEEQILRVGPTEGELPPGAYLQIGSFGVEYNARALVARLLNRTQPARYVNRSVNGAPYSVVVIGPLVGQNAVESAKAAARAEGQPNPLEVTL